MSTLTFEKAMEKLSAVVAQLENGNLPLEKSLKLYEEGIALSSFCEDELKKAELRIREISPQQTGEVTQDAE